MLVTPHPSAHREIRRSHLRGCRFGCSVARECQEPWYSPGRSAVRGRLGSASALFKKDSLREKGRLQGVPGRGWSPGLPCLGRQPSPGAPSPAGASARPFSCRARLIRSSELGTGGGRQFPGADMQLVHHKYWGESSSRKQWGGDTGGNGVLEMVRSQTSQRVCAPYCRCVFRPHFACQT